MTQSMTYLSDGYDSGYALERVQGRYGNSQWWLCWDADGKSPVMVAATHMDGTPATSEERPPFGEYQVVDTYDGKTLVRWNRCTTWRSLAFREVTVDGVTWVVLLDSIGYPWVIKRKSQTEVDPS